MPFATFKINNHYYYAVSGTILAEIIISVRVFTNNFWQLIGTESDLY